MSSASRLEIKRLIQSPLANRVNLSINWFFGIIPPRAFLKSNIRGTNKNNFHARQCRCSSPVALTALASWRANLSTDLQAPRMNLGGDLTTTTRRLSRTIPSTSSKLLIASRNASGVHIFQRSDALEVFTQKQMLATATRQRRNSAAPTCPTRGIRSISPRESVVVTQSIEISGRLGPKVRAKRDPALMRDEGRRRSSIWPPCQGVTWSGRDQLRPVQLRPGLFIHNVVHVCVGGDAFTQTRFPACLLKRREFRCLGFRFLGF